ncbi:hypothetical protein PF001_g25654 [Phytophthora fragariae]|uniref:Uncharacterized protein n=1 Tax=Phytophthora fragariae TaxID=53985 RepID=A0A6A4BW26_9STRA|nr:hypothetical protein PF001_g25654 [Phytophthora fragariae]
MAPSATLQAVKFVLLLPELMEQAIDEPLYAKVTRRMRSGVALCGIGSERERKWKITIEQALEWAVSEEEAETNSSPLIRAPVVILCDDHFMHGQVAACDGDEATINTVDGSHRVAQSNVIRAVPVTTVLLRNLSYAAGDWSLPEISDLHQRILDRILGTNGNAATNDVQQIMHDIVDDDMVPSASENVKWINPLSGQEVVFPIQHAVDYAFYKDGGVEPPPNSVGSSFCTPPTTSQPRQSTTTTRTVRRISILAPGESSTCTGINAMFDAQEDDDDVLEEIQPVAQSLALNHQVRQPDRPAVPPPAKRARTTLSVAQQQHSGEILAALASQPRLQRIFAEAYLPDCAEAASASNLPPTTTTVPPPSDLRMHSDQRDTVLNSIDRNARFNSASQNHVHEVIAAPHHQGTTLEEYGDGMISSKYCLFKPLPGVSTRVRDIQFGKRGLSVMHFQPLAFDEKVAWSNNGGSNFQHLGSSTAIPKAPQPQDVQKVVAACQTLELFASEYFSTDLKASITALVALVMGLARSHVWEADDLPLLVYWINVTLEDYRHQASQATLVPASASS